MSAGFSSNVLAAPKLKVGMVFDIGGKGDQSFNDSAYRGLQWASKLGVSHVEIEPGADADRETGLRMIAEQEFDLVIGVSYSDNIDKVRSLIEDELKKDNRILTDPAPNIVVLELADSSVNFGVRPWTKADDYWGVYFNLTENLKKRFDAEGVSIPFPQRDVHMVQEG